MLSMVVEFGGDDLGDRMYGVVMFRKLGLLFV